MEMKDTYGIRSVERAFTVLRVLSDAAAPRSLPSIAKAAGLSVTTTYRLLRTLESEGVVQTVGAGYILGLRVLELADSMTRQLDLASVTRPYLLALGDELNETCGIGARSGDAWVTVSYVESTQPVRRVMRVGERHALAPTATGRVLLAHDDDADVRAYMDRARSEVDHEQVGGPDQLWGAIHEIRRLGYAWVDNARNTGGSGMRHPLYRHDGRLVGVLAVACPKDRFTEPFRAHCLEAARRIARQMSAALGYSGVGPLMPSEPPSAEPARDAVLAGYSRYSNTAWEE